MRAAVREAAFGTTPDGRMARLVTLETAELSVSVTNFGGRIVSIRAPDRWQQWSEVLLGFADAASYASAGGAFGALLGRNANRIADGNLVIDGRCYRLLTNDRNSTLHGGPRGFDMVSWDIRSVSREPTPTLVLSHVSPDGDQGFPGELSVQATYTLKASTLWLEFEATTTLATPLSLSAHPYFNLAGPESRDALDHQMMIPADRFLPTDARQLPTGEIRPVECTPFDFRKATTLSSRIRQDDEQLTYGLGYDHYFVLGKGGRSRRGLRLAARAFDQSSGRMLEVHTTQPGLQLYTGNKLDGAVTGRGGAYRQSAGFAIEPQGFPDAPHHVEFPSTILRPGNLYRHAIGYRLGCCHDFDPR